MEVINGVTHTTSYEYDLDNRVTSVTHGDTVKEYSYDSYSRVDELVTKHNGITVLTTGYTYRAPTNTTTTGQVASYTIDASDFDVTYSYTYDDNGNILSVSDGTSTTSYVYDTAGQLLRENNQAAGKTWTWTYDSAGNIQSRKEYNYTVDSLDGVTPTDTVAYTYGDTSWGDLLTACDGVTITHDEIGNPLTDGTWTYAWEHGRQLASMTDGTTTWSYEYNADGLRTKRTNGTATYEYIYNGSSLVQMTVGNDTLYFTSDTVTYNGTVYYYVTNLQGDTVAILNSSGAAVVEYSYDAWGNILSMSDTSGVSLGTLNPLRYRGYVYDAETGLYYLQSRYYDPKIGRFINADVLVSTGQGLLGNNMFAYCNNNPVRYADDFGQASRDKTTCPFVVVIIMEDGNGNGAGGGGGGVSPTFLLIDLLIELYTRWVSSPDKPDDESEPVYYGVDLYNGTWNIRTGPMSFQEASNWAKQTAASGKYSSWASWGLYTKNKADAEMMAIHLGSSYEYTHDPAKKDHKPHYHTAGRLICGISAPSFHVWHEE